MFYETQSNNKRNHYKKLLKAIGQLSGLFSDSTKPYLSYRAHERIFVESFKAIDRSRKDHAVDAQIDNMGIALKTWVNSDNQKIAEFGKQLNEYKDLKGLRLVKKIATLRNNRITLAKNTYKIDKIFYHVVRRKNKKMEILECPLHEIQVDNIKLIKCEDKEKNPYFTDGINIYHFSRAKNTLYMIFENLELLDEISVPIIKNPFEKMIEFMKVTKKSLSKSDYLYAMPSGFVQIDDLGSINTTNNISGKSANLVQEKLCLRLYSAVGKKKIVRKKSGLNLWNAGGRNRSPHEIYIPYNAEDRDRKLDFFPNKDTPFNLRLPDGEEIRAKVCQSAGDRYPDSGKSIMSSPNDALGKWLLRNVFNIKENTLVTYEMLENLGVDCVIFTKISNREYSIDLGSLGTYESLYYGEE